MKNLYIPIFVLLFLFNLSIHSTERDEQRSVVDVNGITYTAEVIGLATGTDIILSSDQQQRNLTETLPGENLFPRIFETRDGLVVSWIQYKKGDVKLCVYDSKTDHTQYVVAEGFEFIGNPKPIYWRGNITALSFIGLSGENDDLYLVDLATRRVRNVTKSAEFEKRFEITEIGGESYIQTSTSDHVSTFWVNPRTLNVKWKKTEKRKKRKPLPVRIQSGYDYYNRMLAFGDSITWGKIRMDEFKEPTQDWTEVHYQPHLTYWSQLEDYFNQQYGNKMGVTYNRGVNRETASDGRDRFENDFGRSNAYFCFIMFGTNDVVGNTVSIKSTAGDLLWMWDKAKDEYNMYPIAFTIPPQMNKLHGSNVQYYKDKTETLNQMIRNNAEANGYPLVDTYTAFFDASEGWRELLEDYKGNHPSPLGHTYIMDLIKPIILAMAPKLPGSIQSYGSTADSLSVNWDNNIEFDFSHYEIEYGYYEGQLNRTLSSSDRLHTFYRNYLNSSFDQKLYIKFRAVDYDGNKSEWSEIYTFDFKK